MTTLDQRSTIEVPADELFNWHLRPGAFERLVPPWDLTRVAHRSGRLEDNTMTVDLSVPLAGPLRGTWKIRHDSFEPGHKFRDVMTKGPFATWEHTHMVTAIAGSGTGADEAAELHDSIVYEMPLGQVGRVFGAPLVTKRLESTFAYRHAMTAADLAAHARARAQMPDELRGREGGLRIAVTGATGLIGSALWAYLSTAGHEVIPIVRAGSHRGPWSMYELPADLDPIVWNPGSVEGAFDAANAARLEGLDAVVHLAGEPLLGRWTDAKRARVLASRKVGTAALATALANLARPPRVLVSASAIGAYGDRGEEELDEGAGYGTGFLSEVATAWEAAAEPARAAGIRVVHARTGIVLTPAGGALQPLSRATKLGAGGPLGSGKQWWSWITLDDELAALEWCIVCDELSGAVNLVAPEALRMRQVAKALGKVLRRPSIAPAPALVLRALMGRDVADEMLLASQHVVPAALMRTGFVWRDTDLERALRRVLGR
ncbi:MAG: TIGR01777 family protein [Thermoleophilia bacterium]|nr:TIGR01777 family protein [Thermoleophilia bacterium]